MNLAFWPRLGGTFAIGAASLLAGTAAAQIPVIPATHAEPAPPPPEIERYHGTVKVSPAPSQPVQPAPVMRPPIVEMSLPEPIVQIEARTLAEPAPLPITPPDTRVPDAVVDTLHSVREDTRRVSTAAAVLLGQVGGWLKAPRPESPRTIVPINVNYPAPAAPLAPVTHVTPIVVSQPVPTYYPPMPMPPWMTPAPQLPQLPHFAPSAAQQISASTLQPQPTVIVIREPAQAAAPVMVQPSQAPAVAAPAPTAGTTRGTAPESLLGFGVGVIGLGLGLVSWLRSRKKAEVATVAGPGATATPPDGVMLAGGLYAGPRPEFAEKFDLGPTYEDEQLAKKRQEEESQNAILEFVLSQNIALQAALGGPTTDEKPSGQIEVVETE
ncbi:MAG: hypothetical protein U0792_18220 [Gemmataceae bacterium]